MKRFWIFDFGFWIKGTKSKKVCCLALAGMLVALSVSAEAQQRKKIYRIGYLSAGDAESDWARAEAFRLALRKLGYIEGQNTVIEFRYTGTKPTQSALASELVRLNSDVIVAAGGDVLIRETKDATNTIPIVMMGQGSDPVRIKLIESFARPGGNVTGLTNFNRELGGKRLELLKEILPKLGDVVVIYDPRNPGIALEVKEFLPDAARGLRLSIRSLELQDENDLEKVFARLNKDRPEGLYVSGAGSFMRVNRKRIAELALKARFQPCTTTLTLWKREGLCTTAPTLWTPIGALQLTSINS